MKSYNDDLTPECMAVANYIIRSINTYNEHKTTFKDRVFMSAKRLQKLMFFSDVVYMLENSGKSLYDEDYYAWPTGPIIPAIYDVFMEYQNGAMLPHDKSEKDSISQLTINERATVDRVLADTAKVWTPFLCETSQQLEPWLALRDNYENVIDKFTIYSYYKIHGAPYGQIAIEDEQEK